MEGKHYKYFGVQWASYSGYLYDRLRNFMEDNLDTNALTENITPTTEYDKQLEGSSRVLHSLRKHLYEG